MKTVTLKDIYEVVNRLEDKLDQRIKPIEQKVDDLEDFRGKALGILGVVSFVGSAIFSWVWGKIVKS